MKKLFTKLIIIVFAVSLALFIVLGIIVIILGPQKTEEAIKALFNSESYSENYKKILPFLSKTKTLEEEPKRKEVLSASNNWKISNRSEKPPLIVPTSGIAPTNYSLYSGPITEGKHEGINIWTNSNGTGMDGKTYGKGNPVYSVCDGTVRKVWEENGDVSVICDPIDSIYSSKVPSLEIKALYGHMANRSSEAVYIYVVEGQRVNQGDLIGNQGNRCFWSPRNIMVTVHFGIYDISVAPQIPVDPTPYIGVSCTTLNQKFVAGVK